MKPHGENGLTLVELLVAVSVMAMIATGLMVFLTVCLEAYAEGGRRSEMFREGGMVMEQLTGNVRRCTYLLIPNSHKTSREMLAVSGFHNSDNDFYFNDPLFPRYDEDMSGKMVDDGAPGILGIDDNGNAIVDDGAGINDDDEDGLIDEDPVNGIDDDGDGNIDEDCPEDANNDGSPGIADYDDDMDSLVDEDMVKNDDEDAQRNESGLVPVIYSYDSGAKQLRKAIPSEGVNTVLLENVTAFVVTYEAPDATHEARVNIILGLESGDGKTINYSEYVYPINILQKTGKYVR